VIKSICKFRWSVPLGESYLTSKEATLLRNARRVRRSTLSALPKTAFANDYAYNKFASGPFGIRAPMGAAATVTLPPLTTGETADAEAIRLTDVDGRTFSARLGSRL
jgi:hypothetical protein